MRVLTLVIYVEDVPTASTNRGTTALEGKSTRDTFADRYNSNTRYTKEYTHTRDLGATLGTGS